MKKYTFLFLFYLLALSLQAQTAIPVEYAYDNAGNRIRQKIIELDDLARMGSKNSHGQQFFLVDSIQTVQAKIYPNPTHGLVNVALDNVPYEEKMTVKIFDGNGRKIAERDEPEPQFCLDLSPYPLGVYMVQLTIGDEVTRWRIIKR